MNPVCSASERSLLVWFNLYSAVVLGGINILPPVYGITNSKRYFGLVQIHKLHCIFVT